MDGVRGYVGECVGDVLGDGAWGLGMVPGMKADVKALV